MTTTNPTHSPRALSQSGIARVVYCSDKYRDECVSLGVANDIILDCVVLTSNSNIVYNSWKFVASRRLLDMAGVQCMQHALRQSQVVIDFSSVE
jgi:hypothetical protein